MTLTQMGEVGERGGAAERGIDGVIDLGADRRSAASGESAVLVASAQEAALRPRHAVPVDGHDRAVDGVGEHARP